MVVEMRVLFIKLCLSIDGKALGDMYHCDFADMTWQVLDYPNNPGPMYKASYTVLGERLFIFGGLNENGKNVDAFTIFNVYVLIPLIF